MNEEINIEREAERRRAALAAAIDQSVEEELQRERAPFKDRAHVDAWERHMGDLARAQLRAAEAELLDELRNLYTKTKPCDAAARLPGTPRQELACDDGFDMFSTPLHSLEDKIAQTDDPYTRGYLMGVRDFREQHAILTQPITSAKEAA